MPKTLPTLSNSRGCEVSRTVEGLAKNILTHDSRALIDYLSEKIQLFAAQDRSHPASHQIIALLV